MGQKQFANGRKRQKPNSALTELDLRGRPGSGYSTVGPAPDSGHVGVRPEQASAQREQQQQQNQQQHQLRHLPHRSRKRPAWSGQPLAPMVDSWAAPRRKACGLPTRPSATKAATVTTTSTAYGRQCARYSSPAALLLGGATLRNVGPLTGPANSE